MDYPKEKRTESLFNEPLEIGIRSLFVLQELDNKGCDLERLVYYDYLLIHSGDVEGGPTSIHPPMPFRSGEILIKRDVLKKGLALMVSKELVQLEKTSGGIIYMATELTPLFINYFSSQYAQDIHARSQWVVNTFSSMSDDELYLYIKENLSSWGGEFDKESFIREKSYE